MSATARLPQADPLYTRPLPERPAYATGMLLDAADFTAEQTYHRGRLARALALATGGGTLAGLKVELETGSDGAPRLRVAPGAAIDRLGRLIELPRPACLRLPEWWAATAASERLQACYPPLPATADSATPARLVSVRCRDTATLPARALVADVFLRFVACPQGYTPSFAGGPYDALDAVATARLRDAHELLLVARGGLDIDRAALPGRGADLAAIADPDARSAAAAEAVFAAWPALADDGSLQPLAEHPDGIDVSAQFLARLLIGVGPGNPPEPDWSLLVVDNWPRRFAPSAQLLQRWLGLNP